MSSLKITHVMVALVGVVLFLLAAASASMTVEEWKDSLRDAELAKRQGPSCPGECSHHGTCLGDRCACHASWGGEDCSIPVQALGSGKKVVSSVEAGSWQFFETDVTPGQTITWTVNSTQGDCDLYVRHEEIPTRSLYDQHDIGLAMSFSIQVVNSNGHTARKWYAGVNGFMQCNYAISVSVTGGGGQCVNGCSGHGVCLNDRCQCHDTWAGPDCSIQVRKLSLGQAVSGEVSYMTWQYYSYPISGTSALRVLLNETSAGGDADLFVKFDTLPTYTSFDYRDIGREPSMKLEVVPPSGPSHTMYVGVFGFGATSYNLLVSQDNSCPSQCSRHGQCVGNRCSCNSLFSGTLCETMNQPLADNQPVDGYVADSVWNYYHFVSESITAITIEVDQVDSDPMADCDLFVKAGSVPSLTSFDFADLSYSRQMRITIPDPSRNTWYVGIYGTRRCAYRVRQSISSSCIDGCTPPYGTCTGENTCQCNHGWAGDNCRIAVVPLSAGQMVEGSLSTNQFQYYAFDVTSSFATVSLLEVEPWARGYYWLFVGVEMVPDQENFDYSNKETNTPYHQVEITDLDATPEAPVTVYIGVYGSPFDLAGPNHSPAHFKLSAWQIPF